MDARADKDVYMESGGHESKEMVVERHQAGEKPIEMEYKETESTNNKFRVMYTNTDGVVSSLSEVKDYLREKPELVCLTETKLREEINIRFEKEGYNLWRRDRKSREEE